MSHPGPELALLLLASYRKLVDEAVLELDRRGYPEITPTLHYAMTAIDLGARTASELAQALAVTKQAAAKTVNALASRGFVDVSVDALDSRRKQLSVTDAGYRVMNEGAVVFDELREHWAEQVGLHDIERLEQTLRNYSSNAPIQLKAPGWLKDG